MDIFLIVLAAFTIGAGSTYYIFHRTVKNLRRRVKTLRAGKEDDSKKRMDTSKKITWICLINGFAWVWCSYVLAYLDKPQIAESLSQVAVTEIIGTVLAYCGKSVIENLSKNNRWPDKHIEVDNFGDDSSTGEG